MNGLTVIQRELNIDMIDDVPKEVPMIALQQLPPEMEDVLRPYNLNPEIVKNCIHPILYQRFLTPMIFGNPRGNLGEYRILPIDLLIIKLTWNYSTGQNSLGSRYLTQWLPGFTRFIMAAYGANFNWNDTQVLSTLADDYKKYTSFRIYDVFRKKGNGSEQELVVYPTRNWSTYHERANDPLAGRQLDNLQGYLNDLKLTFDRVQAVLGKQQQQMGGNQQSFGNQWQMGGNQQQVNNNPLANLNVQQQYQQQYQQQDMSNMLVNSTTSPRLQGNAIHDPMGLDTVLGMQKPVVQQPTVQQQAFQQQQQAFQQQAFQQLQQALQQETHTQGVVISGGYNKATMFCAVDQEGMGMKYSEHVVALSDSTCDDLELVLNVANKKAAIAQKLDAENGYVKPGGAFAAHLERSLVDPSFSNDYQQEAIQFENFYGGISRYGADAFNVLDATHESNFVALNLSEHNNVSKLQGNEVCFDISSFLTKPDPYFHGIFMNNGGNLDEMRIFDTYFLLVPPSGPVPEDTPKEKVSEVARKLREEAIAKATYEHEELKGCYSLSDVIKQALSLVRYIFSLSDGTLPLSNKLYRPYVNVDYTSVNERHEAVDFLINKWFTENVDEPFKKSFSIGTVNSLESHSNIFDTFRFLKKYFFDKIGNNEDGQYHEFIASYGIEGFMNSLKSDHAKQLYKIAFHSIGIYLETELRRSLYQHTKRLLTLPEDADIGIEDLDPIMSFEKQLNKSTTDDCLLDYVATAYGKEVKEKFYSGVIFDFVKALSDLEVSMTYEKVYGVSGFSLGKTNFKKAIRLESVKISDLGLFSNTLPSRKVLLDIDTVKTSKLFISLLSVVVKKVGHSNNMLLSETAQGRREKFNSIVDAVAMITTDGWVVEIITTPYPGDSLGKVYGRFYQVVN